MKKASNVIYDCFVKKKDHPSFRKVFLKDSI